MLYPVSLQYSIFANIQVTILYLLNTESYTYVILSRVVFRFSYYNWKLVYFCSLQYQFSCFELCNDFSFEVKGQLQGKEHFTMKLETWRSVNKTVHDPLSLSETGLKQVFEGCQMYTHFNSLL